MQFCGEEYDVMKLMKAADDGDMDAMRMFVTLCYANLEGEVFENTKEKCFEYIKQMAANGDGVAYIWLAASFVKGEFVKKNINKAIEFYQKAAEKGISYGYECIGQLYYDGKDIPTDYEKAYRFIMKSKRKSGMSLYLLGEMYRLGRYVNQNNRRARQYYRRALDDERYLKYEDVYSTFARKRLEGYEGELKGDWES